MDDMGPWNEYEIVDGEEEGAVVGIKRIIDDDTRTEPIFTPAS
jgi:hypothetical protein